MSKFTAMLFVFFFFFSCYKKDEALVDITLNSQEREYINKNDFFEEYKYGDIKPDTIYLSVIIDDCGEWGGPREFFKIYVNKENEFVLHFDKYKFNCDSISYYYNNDTILDIENKILLKDKEKQALSEFFKELMNAKIQEKLNSNAGSIFILHNTDSTMNVSIHTDKTNIVEKFNLLKKELNIN